MRLPRSAGRVLARTLMFTTPLAIASATGGGAPRTAHAFCGFYVAPSDAPLYNDASMVALMREGTRTVMSMSNTYKGPAADFAMVVPVPVVLHKENVKTLPADVFKKLEAYSAPRLVEYWEQDPCPREYERRIGRAESALAMKAAPAAAAGGAKGDDYHVTIEARFTVGEYDVVVLSAEESDGLDRWLRDNKYNIPKGAGEALAPYIKEQQKFFVAKVAIDKVKHDAEGVAVLSPLRFNFESSDFRLPVRLGLLNAQSKQDLLVFVLSRQKRYEVANYPNVFIPTNLDVAEGARSAFGSFYAELFDTTLARSGSKAVVTEYAWMSSSCDPCATPPLDDGDLATLGGDLLFGMGGGRAGDDATGGAVPMPAPAPGGAPGTVAPRRRGPPPGGFFGGGQPMVVTRLHTRYDRTTLGEDLVFRATSPVVGGREFVVGKGGEIEHGARPDSINNFQARYAIRHPWTGPITCSEPRRGVWGGPPSGEMAATLPTPATNLAHAPRGKVKLASLIVSRADEVAINETAPPAGVAPIRVGQTGTVSGAEPFSGVGLLYALFGAAGAAALILAIRVATGKK